MANANKELNTALSMFHQQKINQNIAKAVKQVLA